MGALILEDIQYAYGSQQVLKGISQVFERGRVYAIMGPSGCGKTTLLSLLGGLDEPTAGVIKAEEGNIAAKGLAHYRKHQVAFVFQQFNLIDYLTGVENIQLITQKSPFDMLEKVGLSREQASRSILHLSGGQQQRVAIARALMSEGAILLADEPTGALDEETAAGITSLLLKSAHQMNKCVIIVTHSPELAQQADVVFRLRNGLLEEISLEQEPAVWNGRRVENEG